MTHLVFALADLLEKSLMVLLTALVLFLLSTLSILYFLLTALRFLLLSLTSFSFLLLANLSLLSYKLLTALFLKLFLLQFTLSCKFFESFTIFEDSYLFSLCSFAILLSLQFFLATTFNSSIIFSLFALRFYSLNFEFLSLLDLDFFLTLFFLSKQNSDFLFASFHLAFSIELFLSFLAFEI